MSTSSDLVALTFNKTQDLLTFLFPLIYIAIALILFTLIWGVLITNFDRVFHTLVKSLKGRRK